MTFTQVAGNENGNSQQFTGTAWIRYPAAKTWTRDPDLSVPAIPEQTSLYMLDRNYWLKKLLPHS
jgi:hypothetical protein